MPEGLGPPEADGSEADPGRDGEWMKKAGWMTAPKKSVREQGQGTERMSGSGECSVRNCAGEQG